VPGNKGHFLYSQNVPIDKEGVELI